MCQPATAVRVLVWDPVCACRYHYNVSTDRLLSHVKKGWDQRLFISSATSTANLWALVMDEATGYETQSYKVSDTFLPKVWCMQQWDAGMYITAIAGTWCLIGMQGLQLYQLVQCIPGPLRTARKSMHACLRVC